MKMQAAIIWVWGLVLIAGAIGGGFVWWRQQDVAQAYEAGRAAADADRWEDALALAQPYAERDDPRINGLLADAYINGPDSIQDIDKGLTLRRRAAEAGDMRAAYFLGKWILENEPTDAQAQEAIGYIQEAADCGMPMANYTLGVAFAEGDWVKRDFNKSTYYSEKAAFADIKKAAWNASFAYANLVKLNQSMESEEGKKFLYWLFVSASKGDTKAQDSLDKMKEALISEFGEEGPKRLDSFEMQAGRMAEKIQPAAPYNCSRSSYSSNNR
jgi:TPR repeat protein